MSTSFSVTDNWPHDLEIEDNEIQMVTDEELFRQKLQAVWSTNKGEWSLNKSEGIDFHVILTKNPDEDEIRTELETALEKVSSTAEIASFSVVVGDDRKGVILVQVLEGGSEVTVPLEF